MTLAVKVVLNPNTTNQLVLQIFLYEETFECNTTSVVLHSDLQMLEKNTKNVLENGW